jgi:hypothetical protein
MAKSQADLLAMKAELTNDPMGLGLTVLTEDDAANSDKINEVRSECQIDRQAVPLSEIVAQIDRDEYAALSQPDRDWLAFITRGESINPAAGGEIREGLLQLFGAQSESRGNIVSILTEDAARYQQMYQQGLLEADGAWTPSDIANARQAT